MTTYTAPGSIEFGRVFQQTFAVAGRNPLTFGLTAILLVGVPLALLGYFWPQTAGVTPGASPVFLERLAATILISATSTAVMQATIIHGFVADLNGRRASLAECLSAGVAHALPVMAIGVLTSVAVFGGLILLIVPGILAALAFAVAVPVQVVESTGIIPAFRRSIDLTRNNRGTIFGVNFVMGILVGVISVVVGAVGGLIIGAIATPQLPLLMNVVVSPIASAIAGVFTASSVAAIYFELRRVKEGVGSEQLASVFD